MIDDDDRNMFGPLRDSPPGRWIARFPAAVVVPLKWALRAVGAVVIVLCTVFLVRAFDARRQPDLQPWHRSEPEAEFRARDARGGFDFADYLRVEDEVFAQLDAYRFDNDALNGRSPYTRYLRGGPSDPTTFDRNWNRSFELVPETIVGGAVLVHGLTDSPYSMRSVAQALRDAGFYCVGLRMPGHGTVPAGLLEVKWEDWAAAYELAAAHVAERIGADRPLFAFGYSTGGAVAMLQALESDEDSRRPDGIVLLSPAFGITRLARASNLHRVWSWIPYFEKSKWLGIAPEYDPFKYVSFPNNGGWQTWRITGVLEKRLARAARDGRMADLPTILTFQSFMDATVVVRDTKLRLYDRLPIGESELVLFDINRQQALDGFYRDDFRDLLAALEADATLPYRVTIVANVSPDSAEIVSRSKPPRSAAMIARPLDLRWPDEVYSLSHVAIPFPPDDPLYGTGVTSDFNLGDMSMRGERNVLLVPADEMLRLRHNPMHDFMIERIMKLVSGGGG